MQSDFFPLTAQIAESAADGGISVEETADILGRRDGVVNCYPGKPSTQCHRGVYFNSLNGRLRKGKGHYSFAQMLEEFIKHVQGRCPGSTQQAIIITGAWWQDYYEKWYDNIQAVKGAGVTVEAYLIAVGGSASAIRI